MEIQTAMHIDDLTIRPLRRTHKDHTSLFTTLTSG